MRFREHLALCRLRAQADALVWTEADKARAVLHRAHSSSATAAREREQGRLLEALRAELLSEPERERPRESLPHAISSPVRPLEQPSFGSRPGNEGSLAPGAARSGTSEVNARAEAMAALVERIEQVVREGRSGLVLQLGARAAASSIQVERTGPGQVAVRVRGSGARASELQESLRGLGDALACRGIRVSRLELAAAPTRRP